MNKAKMLFFLVLTTLLVIGGCSGGGSKPTKTVYDISDSSKSEKVIIDSQGGVIFSKTIGDNGAPLDNLFVRDNDILNGKSTINTFLKDEGASVKGSRISDYYPVNVKTILENQNIFTNGYWTTNNYARGLLELEKENLKLSSTHTTLQNPTKEFVFENERVCFQGGKILSNFKYYRSENTECYNDKSASCIPHFNEFPLFKTCHSLTNLKDTFTIPNSWKNDNYIISCNYNSNFATLPSFIDEMDKGYSYCIAKNSENTQEDNTIIFGHYVGNPQLEGNVDSLNVSIEHLFEGVQFKSNEKLSSTTRNIKSFEQKAVDLGKKDSKNSAYSMSELEHKFKQTYSDSYSLLSEPLIGTLHTSSYQNMVTSNYLLLESIDVIKSEFEKYKVTLVGGEEYFVYINKETSWYAISNFNVSLDEIYLEYEKSETLPSRTAQRLLIQKVEDGRTYTLTEESEKLYYKTSTTIYSPSDEYTKFPIYLLKITGVDDSSYCDTLFEIYSYENSKTLTYENAISCIVEGTTLYATINERILSQEILEYEEMGYGYIMLREILFS